MNDAEEERGVGSGLVSSNKHPSYDGEMQPVTEDEEYELGSKCSLVVFLTHSLKEELEDMKECLVFWVSHE